MEFIVEIIFDVIIQGIVDLINNRKRARPWRIFFLTLLIAPAFAVFYAITFYAYPLTLGDYFTGLLMLILGAAWFFGVNWIIRTGPVRNGTGHSQKGADPLPSHLSDKEPPEPPVTTKRGGNRSTPVSQGIAN